MRQREWMDGVNRLFTWFFNLAYLNILWIGFSLLGAVVLGIAPSTAALFAVIRHLLRNKDKKVPIAKTFLMYYRKEFLKINGVFYSLVFIGIILTTEIYFLIQIENKFATVFLYGVVIIGFFYLITCVFIFPVYVHYNLKGFSYLKQALLIGMIRPLHLLLILGMLVIIYYIMFQFLTLFLFFGMSLAAFIMMMVSNLILNEIQEKVEQNK